MIVKNRLGEEKNAFVFEDGSYNCPFCLYAVKPNDTCQNPICSVNDSVENTLMRQILAERKRAEALGRSRQHLLALERLEQENLAKLQFINNTSAEAKRRGACTNLKCLFPRGTSSRTVKFIKHRKSCPNS